MLLSNDRDLQLIKCLVWDLDQTVWQGRILDGDRPQLRSGVRQVLETLDRRGILQSVASTNEHDDAWQHLVQFGIDHYFVFPEINMGHKHESIRRVAERLEMRPEALALIDDDPLERELVRNLLPGVSVFDADEYRHLPDDARFNPPAVTPEGRNRRRMVQADVLREQELPCHATLEAFLKTCDIHFHGRSAEEKDADRICELAQRTNQMNATGERYSADEIRRHIRDGRVLLASLRDRFGDYGTVAAAVVSRHGPALAVDGMWISCRVGKRGLPAAFFTYLNEYARGAGASSVVVHYRRTAANRLARFHLGTYGFKAVRDNGRDTFRWDLARSIRPYPTWMRVNDS